MPKGIYDHKPHDRITNEQLRSFVAFTFRDDIVEKLKNEPLPHKAAVKLYKDETGITISSQTAYKQQGKWKKVGNAVIKINSNQKPRVSKSDIAKYVRFRYDPFIMDCLANFTLPWVAAMRIFEHRTGITISEVTARRHEPVPQSERTNIQFCDTPEDYNGPNYTGERLSEYCTPDPNPAP